MDAYNFIVPTINKSSKTYKTRHQVTVDKYATFKWRGVDSYETFGCLITNNKDLKWTNYAAYTDEFSNPTFSSSVGYLGTTYKQKTITLKLGVYWITEADYRLFLNWLSPDVVGHFSFGYNPNWEYNVKVNSIAESTFYSIGYNEDDETVYYAELTVKLITVNNNYVTSVKPWLYKTIVDADNCLRIFFLDDIENRNEIGVGLTYYDYFQLEPNQHYELQLCQLNDNLSHTTLTNIQNTTPQTVYNLFAFDTSDFSDSNNTQTLFANIEYNSEKGKVYLNNNLLSTLTTINGKEIIDQYNINKMILPGILNNNVFNKSVTLSESGEYEFNYYTYNGELYKTVTITNNNNNITYSIDGTVTDTSYVRQPEGFKWFTRDVNKLKHLTTAGKEFATIDSRVTGSLASFTFSSIAANETISFALGKTIDVDSVDIRIDWGEGSATEETITGDSMVVFSHTFTQDMTDVYIEISNLTSDSTVIISNIMPIASISSMFSNHNLTEVVLVGGFECTNYLFAGCATLQKVCWNNSNIPLNCFGDCINLQFINLGLLNNKSIATNAFINCSALKELYLPDKNILIQQDAFKNCEIDIRVYNFDEGEHLQDTGETLSQFDIIKPFYLKLIKQDLNNFVNQAPTKTQTVMIYSQRQM